MNYGILSLLPVAVVIVLVFFTRRTAASLLAGGLVGAVLLYGTGFASPWLDVVYGVLGSQLYIWIVLVCGLFGSLVALFELSGGVMAFTQLAGKFCKGPRSTMLVTWILGMLVFVDDWLSILSSGTAMRRSFDRMQIPRESLAYIINGTASSVCVIVPTSTWGVFMLSQLVATGACEASAGIGAYLKVIPLLFYPLLSLLFVGLFSAGIIPRFGPMKQAVIRSKNTAPAQEESPEAESDVRPAAALNFILPVVLITIITIATGEILYGTFAAMVFCFILYIPQRLMKPGKYLDTALAGFKDMVGVLTIVACAFVLRDINALLGMPEFVIGAAKAALNPSLLPGFTFILVTILGVAAGNFWGICAISFPVIIPIAVSLDAGLLLTASAIISATTASSQICFYGSEATITCATAQIEPVQYAKACIPCVMPAVVLTAVFYLIAGFLF